jgi:hypothetical protein
MGGAAVTQQDGMEHEVEDPRPKQDHRHQDRVTIVHEPDVDGPGCAGHARRGSGDRCGPGPVA